MSSMAYFPHGTSGLSEATKGYMNEKNQQDERGVIGEGGSFIS